MPNSYNTCIHELQRKVARRGINYSLARLSSALTALGHPEKSLPPIIHIAGTNGKGSVAHYLNQALISQNYTVLSYTSPHINSYKERFTINGSEIDDQTFCELFYQVNQSDIDDLLSEYEVLTLMALCYASTYPFDYLILETGLGGRLDATNVIKDSIAVITDIGLDHCDLLGNSIQAIAAEKAGIIKSNAIVITHFDHDETVNLIINEKATQQQATVHLTPKKIYQSYHDRNKALAQQTCNHLHHSKPDELQSIIVQSEPPIGRLSKFEYLGQPCTIDVGHNVNAVDAILNTSKDTPSFNWIIGMQSSKDYLAVIETLIDHQQKIFLCNFDPKKSVSFSKLPSHVKHLVRDWKFGDTIPENTLFFGSFFFIEALESYQKSIKVKV